jgi:predicted nucleic acid-binding protein
MARRAREPVVRVSAFWDTSALVPLTVYQNMTPRVVALYRRYDIVVWWSTPVELVSALARLVRMRQLDLADASRARGLAKSLADSWAVVQPSEALRRRATELVEHYGLRAADALQLAAALEWCEGASQGRVFLTADRKLREAASLSGFNATSI